MLARTLLRSLTVAAAMACAASAQDPSRIVVESTTSETAVLDVAQCDKSLAGQRYFDAVRPMLVRFPGLAPQVFEKLRAGYAIEKAELVLEWDKQEGPGPERGRSGWGAEDAYRRDPGQWSAAAHALLKPWSATEPSRGPTSDCYLSSGFWSRASATGDGRDRLAVQFGPVPLHAEHKTAAIDITPLLGDEAYAKTLGGRLRSLEQNGLRVHKHELFDIKYNDQEGWWFDVYAWRVSTGCMRIWVKEPRLVISLRKGEAGDLGELPPPLDLAALAARLAKAPDGRPPSAPPDDWAERVKRHTSRPADMPEWQWQRIEELRRIGGWRLGRFDVEPLLSLDREKYQSYLSKSLLRMPPRTWEGHLTSDFALLPSAYGDLLSDAALDYLKLYWTAWLHPETEDVESPRLRSYFRTYSFSLGTQNFNYNAVAGCYLGGQLLGAANALADARYGIENIMSRMHGFYGGANQEVGDTYYQALSNAAPQMIARYARDPVDRLMAAIVSDRLTEQLVSMYNPALRRMTHPMGRGELKYQLLYQDGPYHALHTLSKSGVLLDAGEKYGSEKHRVPVFGGEGLPGRFATLAPFGRAYWSNMVDRKPEGWMVHARWFALNDDNASSGWHVDSLGPTWSLATASQTVGYAPVTPLTAQWRRAAQTPEHMEDLSTLQMSFGVNGHFFQAMINIAAVQHQGKVIAMAALPPKHSMRNPPNPDYAGGWRAKDPNFHPMAFNAVHNSIAVTALGDVSAREVWIGSRKVDCLSGNASPPNLDPKYAWDQHMVTTGRNSVFSKEREVIAIRDGVSYVALIPVTCGAMDRDQEVEVAYEWPSLYVNSFLYCKAGAGLNLDDWYSPADGRRAAGGFVIVMGDRGRYGSFQKFLTCVQAAKVAVQWNAAERRAEVSYADGDDRLELSYRPWDGTPYRRTADDDVPILARVNGKEGYVPPGIQRDTPWSVQGSSGRIEKCGAILESERGHRTYLLADSTSGTYAAYNPVPDPIFFRLTTPEGAAVRADGRLGLARIHVCPAAGTVEIEHGLKPSQQGRSDLARAIVLTGFAGRPRVLLDGQAVASLPAVKIDGRDAYVVPLGDTTGTGSEPRKGGVCKSGGGEAPVPVLADVTAVAGRVAAADALWKQVDESAALTTYFHDWYAVGPFPAGGNAEPFFQLKDFGPEKGVDLQATYQGIKPGPNEPLPAEVKWQPLLAPGEPAMSGLPVDLRPMFRPNAAMAYLAATIVSDADRTVQLLAGSDERLAVWLGGRRVLFNRGYRLAYRDQDRVFIPLKRGENNVLLKVSHGFECWRLYFRLADENGLPLGPGVSYRGPRGLTPASGRSSKNTRVSGA